MNINDYFEQQDTPSKHSPVGALMVKVLAKNPGMTLEGARQEANRLLDRAAGCKKYVTPTAYSPAEQAARLEKTRAYFSKSRTVQKAA